MAQSAMSATAIWDGEWALHSYNLDDWLFFKDEINKNEVNDPSLNDHSLNLTKHETAKQVLHDIEDLGRNDREDWLDDFALFDELQTLIPVDEANAEQTIGNSTAKWEPNEASPKDVSVVSEQPVVNQDLLSVSYENTATFVLSNENILYINNQPFVSLTPLQPERLEIICEDEILSAEETIVKRSENANVRSEDLWKELNTSDVKTEMAVVDEIIRNTAQELEQWESDTSQSEISSDGTSSSDLSPKEEEEEEAEETDDLDWKPGSLKITGRIRNKWSKPYRRCGNQEDKTLRKKEQNRHAATRYRQKKKAEANEILKDEEMLKKRKSELEEKVVDIQREIKCLKELMRDLFKAKGIIN